jgi:RNA-directed DNA polymerase
MTNSLEYITGRSTADLLDIVENIKLHYISYKVKKANKRKFRWIDAPSAELKFIQRNLVNNFFSKASVHESVHGFVKNKSSVTNAKEHLGNNLILSIDIEDFFPSIDKEHIMHAILATMLETHLYLDKQGLKIVNALVGYKNCLPQGAPTSPIISNIVFKKLDIIFDSFFKEADIVYSRYADDITISSKKPDIGILGYVDFIKTNLRSEKFLINNKKTKILSQNKRMLVTGVVVNKKLGTPRWYWRNLRAELHNLQRSGAEISNDKFYELNGKISWIYSLNPIHGSKLKNSLSKIPLKS